MSEHIFWVDRIPGSILIRRWCDACDAATWRWHRHSGHLLALVDTLSGTVTDLELANSRIRDRENESRGRLAAVLAECDRAEEGHRDVLAEVFEYEPEPAMVHVDRIRRAATGEGT